MKFGMNKGSLVVLDRNRINVYQHLGNLLDVISNPDLLSKSENIEVETLPLLELPIKHPSKIICLAKNYVEHAKEMGVSSKDIPALSVTPSLFLKPPSALIGPGENIIIPDGSDIVHHEVELAVIIGKKGKNIPLKKSQEYIFGYSIILDITERTIQSAAKKNGKPWFQSKGFDTFAPMGPLIVTADEIKYPQNLPLELKVNNITKQKGNTREMIFKIDEIISYTSSIVTLEIGDIIATGTPSGVGPLNRGDLITANIESIGKLAIGVI